MNPIDKPFPYFSIFIEEHTFRIIYPSITEGIPISNYRVLIEEPAQWLYAAIAGHFFYQHPSISTSFIANAARAHTLQNAKKNNAWLLAQQVVMQWGSFFRPWFGVWRIDKNGEIIENLPEYHRLFGLNGQQLASTEHFYYETNQNSPGIG
jgi:hypothetical protein